MNNKFNELSKLIKTIAKNSERDLENMSETIDEIIENGITNERTISYVFDNILSIEFVDDDKKRKVFYKLSNYCRRFNKKLADDYDEILEQDLNE